MKKVISAVVFLSVFTIFVGHSFAVPVEFTFQGLLTDKEMVAVNGLTNMTFRLYVEGEPDPVWEEAQDVLVSNGVYSVVLGGDIEGNAIDPVIFDQQVYLGVQVDKDEEMTPRQKLTSASYSIRSETSITAGSANSANTANTATLATNANFANVATSAQNSDTVDGQHATAFATTVHTHHGTDITLNTLGSDQIRDGSISDGDISTLAAIDPSKIADGSGSGLDADFLDGKDYKYFMSAAADNWVNEGGDTMTGHLALPLNGLTVGSNQLVVSGGNVGIGTTSPGQKLSVAGVIESTSGGIKFPDGTVQTTSLTGGTSNVIVVDSSGAGFTTIQAAINAITPSAANRYTIEVRPGTYLEDIAMKSHIHLKGSGMDGTVIAPATLGGTAISMTGLVGVKISGFTFQPESNPLNGGGFWGILDNGSAFEVTECRFTHNGSSSAGIYGTGSINPYIHHNEFTFNEGHGIFFDTVEYSVITNNYYGQHYGSQTIWLLNSAGEISRNTFIDNVTSEAILIDGIYSGNNAEFSRHNIITDNYIHGGIIVENTVLVVIKGNRFTGGFITAGAQEVIISGNSITSPPSYAITVSGLAASVIGNTVWGTISTSSTNAQITGNTVIAGNYPGIDNSGNARVANNTITGGNPSILDRGITEIVGNYIEPVTGIVAINNSAATGPEFNIWGNRVVQTPPDNIGQRIVTPAGIHLETTGDDIVITSGASEIRISPGGDIQITGSNNVDITAAGNLNLSGSNVTVEASSTLDLNGANINVHGAAITDIEGSIVRIN